MNSLRTKIIDRKNARNIIVHLQAMSSASSTKSSEIKIPMRKERGPTDILRALESTVHRDPTAADYKFIDDPFLIPTSLSKKRMYSLSRESGKKAALWVLDQHADLLKSNLSEPLVEAFLPPEKYEDKSQVSEEILLKFIREGQLSEAHRVYKLLEENVSKSSKQAMLEMLCFHNSNLDQIPIEFPEERSYMNEQEIVKNCWNDNPDVESLFGELKNDPETAPLAYSALIGGTAKYRKVDRAYKLYQECQQQQIPISVTAYNMLLQTAPLLKDNNEERKVLLLTFFQSMLKEGIRPNVVTLNSMLKSAAALNNQGIAKQLALSILSEFKELRIYPSLASYYYLLAIFCRENSPTSTILLEILDELEKLDEIVMQEPADKLFFVHAMDIAAHHLHNLDAGNRLHKILLKKDNYKLIGGRLNENIYYRHYLQLLLNSETLDVFMKIYDDLVPHTYIPEPTVMKNIIDMLGLNERSIALEYLPKLLSHMIMFDMLDRQHLMKITLQLMVKKCQPDKESPLHKQYGSMAWTLWTHLQEQSKKRVQKYMWSASLFGNMGVLLVRSGDFEKMLEVLSYLVNSQDAVVGTIDSEQLKVMFDACMDRGHFEGVLMAVEYASDFGFAEVDPMVKLVPKAIALSDSQKKKLDELVSGSLTRAKVI